VTSTCGIGLYQILDIPGDAHDRDHEAQMAKGHIRIDQRSFG
jgi:hypothetical protein